MDRWINGYEDYFIPKEEGEKSGFVKVGEWGIPKGVISGYRAKYKSG